MPDRMPDRMPESMPDKMSDKMSEIKCQIQCQIECQIRMLDSIVRVCYKYFISVYISISIHLLWWGSLEEKSFTVHNRSLQQSKMSPHVTAPSSSASTSSWSRSAPADRNFETPAAGLNQRSKCSNQWHCDAPATPSHQVNLATATFG